MAISINDNEFHRLVDYIKDNYGINLTQKKVLIEGRLSNELDARGFKSYSDFLDMVFSDPTGSEIVNLLNRLTTNHTYFLREPEHYQFMREVFLPEMEKKRKDKKVIYCWSAG